MTSCLRVVVAPNFHLPGSPAGRLLVGAEDDWHTPTEDETAAIMPGDAARDELGRLVLLFILPVRLRSALGELLEQPEAGGDFDAFAREVGRFLAFKELPPPERAVFELVLLGPGGAIEPRGLWAVVNMGDDPVMVGLPGLRLRLEAGEGCRPPEGAAADVLPPAGALPDVLLVVRRSSEEGSAASPP
jgi:hypothetical protein